MKILSTSKNRHYLVQLSESELCNILGHYSIYRDNIREKIEKAINEELELTVSHIYEKHQSIYNIQNLVEYDRARKKLMRMLEALTPIEDSLNRIILSDEKSN